MVKKILALFMAATLMLSMASCTTADTSWVFEIDGHKITSGEYILQTMFATQEMMEHEDYNPEVKDIEKQIIDSKSGVEWVREKAEQTSREYVAVERKFKELGLSFGEKENNIVDTNIKNAWSQFATLYQSNYVAEDTVKRAYANSQKATMIFDKMYRTGGVEEVSTEVLQKHFEEKFAFVNIFSIPLKTPAEGEEELTEEQKADNKVIEERALQYAESINRDKKTYNEVFDKYRRDELGEDYDESAEENKIQDDMETAQFVKSDSEYPSKHVIDTIFNEMKTDEVAAVISDEFANYIVVRYAIDKREDNFSRMEETLLSDLKGEDFLKMIEELGTTYDIIKNEASIKRYDPKNVKI